MFKKHKYIRKMINISFLNWYPDFDTDTTKKTGHFSLISNILKQIGCDFKVTKPSIAHVIFFLASEISMK